MKCQLVPCKSSDIVHERKKFRTIHFNLRIKMSRFRLRNETGNNNNSDKRWGNEANNKEGQGHCKESGLSEAFLFKKEL